MIYLFHGSDIEKVRRQAFAFIEAARVKQPDLAYIHLAREELSAGALIEIASAGALFVSRLLVLLDDPLPASRATEEAKEESAQGVLEEYLEELAKSDNAIIILAPKLTAPKAKKIAARAVKTYHFDLAPSRAVARGFNAPLVNALAAHDHRKLWLEILRSLRAGDAPEQVHGLLHWKARDLLEKRPSPATRSLSLSLITLLMESRRKGTDLAESLEGWALSI